MVSEPEEMRREDEAEDDCPEDVFVDTAPKDEDPWALHVTLERDQAHRAWPSGKRVDLDLARRHSFGPSG